MTHDTSMCVVPMEFPHIIVYSTRVGASLNAVVVSYMPNCGSDESRSSSYYHKGSREGEKSLTLT